jgi:uncharacterized caspase-like protein
MPHGCISRVFGLVGYLILIMYQPAPGFAQEDPLRHGHALIIGTWAYSDARWPPLPDIELQIRQLNSGLASHFDTVDVLRNPSFEELDDGLRRFLREYGNDDKARLFIYYAGHGFTEVNALRNEYRGYITGSNTPYVDGSERSVVSARVKALSMGVVRDEVSEADARQVLFVFDSCFAGTVFTARSPLDPPRRLSETDVTRVMALPVRQFITAGDMNEKIPAHSPIPDLLLYAISGAADPYGLGVVTGQQIQQYLWAKVHDSGISPREGKLPGGYFDRGEFLFRVSASKSPGLHPGEETRPSTPSAIVTDSIVASTRSKVSPGPMKTPVVEIADPAQGATVTASELEVTYSARTSADDPITGVEAQIDGRKIAGDERVLIAAGDTRLGIFTIQLPQRDATISVIAYNKSGASEPASVHVNWAGLRSEPKPNLYVLAVGISDYKDERVRLRYPAKDAEDFVRAVKDHSAGIYDAVITYPEPPGGKWTRDAVLDALDWIRKKPTNRDVAIIFLPGHGVVTPDQAYRFLPYDYDADRTERTTVRDVEFEDALSRISGKTLVFIDTSYSGRGFDKFVNKLGSAESGIVVFTSSTGDQLAMEKDEWANGAFTRALVEGLDGEADPRKTGVVRVSGLEDYVYDRVKALTKGAQTPMVAKSNIVPNFPIVAVTK